MKTTAETIDRTCVPVRRQRIDNTLTPTTDYSRPHSTNCVDCHDRRDTVPPRATVQSPSLTGYRSPPPTESFGHRLVSNTAPTADTTDSGVVRQDFVGRSTPMGIGRTGPRSSRRAAYNRCPRPRSTAGEHTEGPRSYRRAPSTPTVAAVRTLA